MLLLSHRHGSSGPLILVAGAPFVCVLLWGLFVGSIPPRPPPAPLSGHWFAAGVGKISAGRRRDLVMPLTYPWTSVSCGVAAASSHAVDWKQRVADIQANAVQRSAILGKSLAPPLMVQRRRRSSLATEMGDVEKRASSLTSSLVGLWQDRAGLTSTNVLRPTTGDTVFVSLASFRDVECASTLHHLYRQAAAPQRIFVGLTEQNELPQEQCVTAEMRDLCASNPFDFCFLDNVRIRKTTPAEAKGPTFGRYVAALLYRGESYFFLLDSHNRFAYHWDVTLLSVYSEVAAAALKRQPPPGEVTGGGAKRRRPIGTAANTSSSSTVVDSSSPSFVARAVLSHYPASYDGGNSFSTPTVMTTVMCRGHFMTDGTLEGLFRMEGHVRRANVNRLQPFSAAGFLFADARLLREVPYDPYLDYLFDGEEILYTVRMWTHGWDIFAPRANVVFHMYGRDKAPRVWSVPGNNWHPNQQFSNRRVHMFLETRAKSADATWDSPPREVPPASIVADAEARLERHRAASQHRFYRHRVQGRVTAPPGATASYYFDGARDDDHDDDLTSRRLPATYDDYVALVKEAANWSSTTPQTAALARAHKRLSRVLQAIDSVVRWDFLDPNSDDFTESQFYDDHVVAPGLSLETSDVRMAMERERYGLGRRRSLREYWAFARQDPILRRKSNAFCDSMEG
mgnify:FL=1